MGIAKLLPLHPKNMEDSWKTLRETYLQERVKTQIEWYEKKSAHNKRWFYRLRIVVIVSGALIPLFVGYAEGDLEWLRYVAGALGVAISASEGILTLRRYRELWSTYRITAERLNRERLLYENRATEAYANDDEAAFRRFVWNAEQIMSSENEEWLQYIKQSEAPPASASKALTTS